MWIYQLFLKSGETVEFATDRLTPPNEYLDYKADHMEEIVATNCDYLPYMTVEEWNKSRKGESYG